MPTVTGSSNCSPVRPSRSITSPSSGRPARLSSATIVSIGAPSKTGVAILMPSVWATHPRGGSRTWPRVIRLGPPRRVEHDVDGRSIGQVGHVFSGHDPADHTLVSVAPGHLVAGRDLSLLGDVDPDHLLDSWAQ